MSTTTITAIQTALSASPTPDSEFSITPTSPTGRVVRFDQECVLIPELKPRPKRKMLTKSYSLPLWKKKPSGNNSDSDLASSPPLDENVVLKVSLPSFMSKARHSHSPVETVTPMPPCLVHRAPSSSPVIPSATPRRIPMRRPSLPADMLHCTVPLRACCSDCVHVTEESAKVGDSWELKFSKGAMRRVRSASMNDSDNHHAVTATPCSSSNKSGFVAAKDPESQQAFVASKTISITVDEVDKRRKSQEVEDGRNEEGVGRRSSSARQDRVSSSSSTASSSGFTSSDEFPVRASPIKEEDEDELFPLPSPRRSPNSSPKTSPSGSPNGSSTSLTPNKDALGNVSPIGRRRGRCSKGLLTADALGCSLPAPKSPEEEEAVVKDTSSPPATPVSIESSSTLPVVIKTQPISISKRDTQELPVLESPSPPPQGFSSPSRSSEDTHIRTPSSSPPISYRQPSVSPTRRRSSFSSTVLKAGSDVLKGVSSIAGGGGTGASTSVVV